MNRIEQRDLNARVRKAAAIQVQGTLPMAKTPKTFDLRWRGEDYGAFSGARSAFRFVPDPDPTVPDWSETARKRLRAIFIKSGYLFAESRGAWITYEETGRARLCASLEAAGYTVTHAGAWEPEQVTVHRVDGETFGALCWKLLKRDMTGAQTAAATGTNYPDVDAVKRAALAVLPAGAIVQFTIAPEV